ncbi:nickel ABC transporter ATP-binding protein NikE [Geminicoccus flavidas]|uniref:nickel ABC transporter ATP-binding protein NikE n=1 Tax=Geminicoccus flavidas TaxID=2506407 RepID=UPI001357E4A3|nr:ABC transporter ATP-binding protein [Geminicoccus flavidas]
MTGLLEVEHLTIRSPGDPPLVREVSFRIAHGERLGIVGPSGSGKSLTALAIAGLLPDGLTVEGSVRLDGREILDLPEAELARLRGRRIAMVFQEPLTALDPARRIGRQVAEPLAIHGLGTPLERMARAEALLRAVGLPPERASPDSFPHELSGGQRQRVLIAAALAAGPDLLLADEPTTALDLVTQRQILDLMDELVAGRGLALLLVSHDEGVIARMCRHVLVMEAGRIIRSGPAAAPSTGGAVLPPQPRERPEPPALLAASGVSRRYRLPGGAIRQAVDRVDLAVAPGEAVGLVGGSGSGKSTLVRLLTGLERPDAGLVRLDGRDPAEPAVPRHPVQLVFQDPFDSLDPRWRVGRILAEPLHGLRLAPAVRHRRVLAALAEVGLPAEAVRRHPHTFSGGQRQRIAIARALVAHPRLVVLDEPLSALDRPLQEQVLELLAALRARHGLAYLLVSHDLDIVRRLCSRVLVMAEGRIVEEGPVGQVLLRPASAAARALLAARLAPPAPPVAPPKAGDYEP